MLDGVTDLAEDLAEAGDGHGDAAGVARVLRAECVHDMGQVVARAVEAGEHEGAVGVGGLQRGRAAGAPVGRGKGDAVLMTQFVGEGAAGGDDVGTVDRRARVGRDQQEDVGHAARGEVLVQVILGLCRLRTGVVEAP